jgi:hypothetical protein
MEVNRFFNVFRFVGSNLKGDFAFFGHESTNIRKSLKYVLHNQSHSYHFVGLMFSLLCQRVPAHISVTGSTKENENMLSLKHFYSPHMRARIAQSCSIRLRTGWSGFRVPAGAGNFLFTTTSRPPLGTTQPHIQWVPGALSLRVKWPLTSHLHLVPRSTMHGAIPPLSHYFFMAWSSVEA